LKSPAKSGPFPCYVSGYKEEIGLFYKFGPNNIMTILILGATGRTGRHLLKQALTQIDTIHVLVRDRGKISPEAGLKVFDGTPADEQALEKAMQGCDAVLSTLNISRTTDFPWSPLRTPKDFLSDCIRKIISTCDKVSCKRILITSAWGVNETKKEIPGWFRWFIDNSNIRFPYLDHGVAEKLLTESPLEWTIVRPVGLTNHSSRQQVIVSFNGVPRPRLTISRQTVARFMLDALAGHRYIRQAPVISAGKP
jgi:putative NADH-flavin reductase